ncbi:parallel beta-helix domain-containing protein [Kangiella sp. TOML190]|uniref:parallel beta-helix domain-containing protein n=1 Tax=Kangiella sp. TOML190 TaxID=2931351 RepID=UPI00203B573F|nr:parallel beta-helix domain-containing protein [Kangiella sp. TOML190]
MKNLAAVTSLLLLVACSDDKPVLSESDKAFQKTLMTQLISAKSGDIIELPAGNYSFNRSLSLNVDGVTIRGQGQDKSILSFKAQIQGAEGLIVNADNITLENFAIEDAVGDALKVNESENLIIRGIRTEWTNGPDVDNGAYGIYPVQSKNVLIENSIAIGASDAGIYVGQSENIVVRNNIARHNVAGIEIENSYKADVYNNLAEENTGGILVFNMAELEIRGHHSRVFNNKVYNNNTDNFAAKGVPVSVVPAGTGIMVLANDEVEIFDNELKNNNTAHITIASYFSAEWPFDEAKFDPYPQKISIHDNQFIGGGESPDHFDLKALKVAKFGLNGALPNIIWDGAYDTKKFTNKHAGAKATLCIYSSKATFANVDLPNDLQDFSTDRTAHDCQDYQLEAVVLPEHFNS